MPLQLAELAIHIPSAILLFEKYEFDYYQNGKQTLKEACEQKGLDFRSVDAELAGMNKADIHPLTMDDMDLNLLIERINGQHHDHESEDLSNILKEIQSLIAAQNPGNGQLMALAAIEKAFTYLKERLLAHCRKEDKLLFPMIRQMTALQKGRSAQLKSAITEVKELVKTLETEHRESISLISDIKSLLRKIDKTDLPSYAVLMALFKEFELDFHVHMHIENNVLFPKIKEMDEPRK